MPQKARVNGAGALHHIADAAADLIVPGIRSAYSAIVSVFSDRIAQPARWRPFSAEI